MTLVRLRVKGQVVRVILLVQVVKQWLTSRADGELHIISVTWSVGTSGTSRTTHTTHTGRETMAYNSYKW